MTLFIADEPFSIWVDPAAPSIRCVEIRLRMALTEPTALVPPPTPTLLEFVLDTGTDYAIVSASDLAASRIPILGPSGGRVTIIWANGRITQELTRDVTLWLFSNLPGLANQPYRIDFNGGVAVLSQSNPNAAASVRPLLGMNPLLDAGLRIELNAQTRRFSVWVP